jgi:hypothetical protein
MADKDTTRAGKDENPADETRVLGAGLEIGYLALLKTTTRIQPVA